MALSKEQRDALEDKDFAIPEKRLLPLVDRELVLMASNNLDFVKGITEDEREKARIYIFNRGVELGIKRPSINRCNFTLEAMSLDLPTIKDHPNRHPFTGIMTRLDVASDFPVGGTTRKKVVIPMAVAEKAIPTLLGMAIDYTPAFDGHDRRAKIGVITEAWIGEVDSIQGTPLHISGFFYAADFPDEVAAIQSKRDDLGFSYEAQALVESLDSDPWVCTSCDFTGAAVLLKNKAAFTRTSIAASSQGDQIMLTPEQIAELQAKAAKADELAKENATLKADADKARVSAASLQNLVKPHADALRQCATNMVSAGIGADASSGHAAILNKMADHMEAQSVMGRIPSSFDSYFYGSRSEGDPAALQAQIAAAVDAATKPLLDQVASLNTKVTDAEKKAADLQAAGTKTPEQLAAEANSGNRKSLHPTSVALLKKIGLDASAQKLDVAAVDKACREAGLTSSNSMALKLNLRAQGVFASA